jgi:DNA-binding transcriptional MerR regulator
VRIGELATRSGVSTRALRYYEEQGLLVATRSSSGQRHYPETAVDRVGLIQQLYQAGLASRTIVDLLPCVDAPGDEATRHTVGLMSAERDRLQERIDDLIRTRDTLDRVIGSAVASLG